MGGTARYILTFRWANVLSEAAGWLSAAALIAATAVMMHGVSQRYFFGQPTIWQTEMSIYLLMFVAFVGGAYGLKHHAHVGVDLLVDRLPERPRLVVRIVTAVLALAVSLAVLYSATHEWQAAIEGGWRTPTAWEAPLSVVYGILPLGMLLIALQLVAFIIDGVLALTGRLEPGRTPALLGQGNAEFAAATTVLGDDHDIKDEVIAPPAGDAGAGAHEVDRSHPGGRG